MSVIILTPWDSQGNQITDSDGICHTIRGCGGGGYQQGYILERMKYRMTACYGGGMEPAYMSDRKGHNGVTEDGTATTLNAQEKERPVVGTSIVRRLTPTECARLQGFPDWWCADVPHADSAEYKMWGNGVSLPCVLYVMEGIAKALKGEK